MQEDGAARFTAEELENSILLDKARKFAHQRGHDLVSTVLAAMDGKKARLRARKAPDQQRANDTVDVLLANLLAAHLNAVDPDRFVALGFSRSFYAGTLLSYETMCACRDYMDQERLIELAPGFSRPDSFGDGRLGRLTRMRASPLLREMFDEADLGKRPLNIAAPLLLRIKAASPELGPAPAHIAASIKTIEAINRRIATVELGLRPEVIVALKSRKGEDEGEDAADRDRKSRYAGDLTATSIYRAFKGDWQSGGRFYGGWWMSLPRAFRPYITIDGEPVVELDYSTLHPLLLYRRAGLRLPTGFDPYLVPPWRGHEMRNLGKRTFNRLLNRSETDPVKRLKIRAANGDPAILPKGTSFAMYRTALVAHVQPIAQWFGTKEGVRLQYADSELALDVMRQMEEVAIPILPIHDSFLVAERHEEALRFAMQDAFLTRYDEVPLIDRKGPAPAPHFRDTPDP